MSDSGCDFENVGRNILQRAYKFKSRSNEIRNWLSCHYLLDDVLGSLRYGLEISGTFLTNIVGSVRADHNIDMIWKWKDFQLSKTQTL